MSHDFNFMDRSLNVPNSDDRSPAIAVSPAYQSTWDNQPLSHPNSQINPYSYTDRQLTNFTPGPQTQNPFGPQPTFPGTEPPYGYGLNHMNQTFQGENTNTQVAWSEANQTSDHYGSVGSQAQDSFAPKCHNPFSQGPFSGSSFSSGSSNAYVDQRGTRDLAPCIETANPLGTTNSFTTSENGSANRRKAQNRAAQRKYRKGKDDLIASLKSDLSSAKRTILELRSEREKTEAALTKKQAEIDSLISFCRLNGLTPERDPSLVSPNPSDNSK